MRGLRLKIFLLPRENCHPREKGLVTFFGRVKINEAMIQFLGMTGIRVFTVKHKM